MHFEIQAWIVTTDYALGRFAAHRFPASAMERAALLTMRTGSALFMNCEDAEGPPTLSQLRLARLRQWPQEVRPLVSHQA